MLVVCSTVEAEMRAVDLDWRPYDGVLAAAKDETHPSERPEGEIDVDRGKAMAMVATMRVEDCVEVLRR